MGLGTLEDSHWCNRQRRKVEEHAWQLLKVLRAAAFTYSPLLYWRNKQTNKQTKNTLWHEGSYHHKPFLGYSPTDYQVDIPDSLWQSDTCEGRHYAIRESSTKAQAFVPMQPVLLAAQQLFPSPGAREPVHMPSPYNLSGGTFCNTPPHPDLTSYAEPLCLLSLSPLEVERNVRSHFFPNIALVGEVSMSSFGFRVSAFAH
uniref:testis-expressed protein 38-like n=1 Tax=Ictidomys tridecemlineatus TaxID=43179 RepID=UPI00038BD49E|nr:testis-expressed protein 38-like [Ictidomys tridecemlineatus]